MERKSYRRNGEISETSNGGIVCNDSIRNSAETLTIKHDYMFRSRGKSASILHPK